MAVPLRHSYIALGHLTVHRDIYWSTGDYGSLLGCTSLLEELPTHRDISIYCRIRVYLTFCVSTLYQDSSAPLLTQEIYAFRT